MASKKAKQFTVILIIIAIAALVSIAGGTASHGYNGIPVFVICGALAFIINWLAFIPANASQTEKYYDITGTITYLSVIAVALVLTPESDLRAKIAAILVCIWAIRLGSFLFKRISQDGHDDRFDQIKTQPLRFFITWSLQGLWVLLTVACALAIITNSETKQLGLIGYVGILVWIIGFAIEATADAQKRSFRKDPANKGRFINVGLWAWSRHPNYFGEITLWTGMAILALPILSGWAWACLISPIFVYVLLTRVSGIPMLAKKGLDKWGNEDEYRKYLEKTSLLIPLPPRN